MAHLTSTPEGQGKGEEPEGRFVDIICPSCGTSRKEREFAPEKSVDMRVRTIYSALHPEKRDIRILTVSSGVFNDEIQCKLHSVSLDDNPSYTALSYCWGDANQRGYIRLNGQKVSVAKSLELALRYMRHIEVNVVVWADAICINQDDTIEKSFQVTMMGDIYAKGK
jgi:Heterokaryon incompatibility protein (HET)